MPRNSDEPETVAIFPTNPDPLASLGITQITVDFAGQEFVIPALAAVAWLKILLAQDLDLEAVFPGLAGPQAVMDVNNLILDGAGSQDELEQAILDVLEVASGRSWWITLRLCVSVRAHWEWVGGDMARHGVTPFDVPLSYWLDGAYVTMFQGILERTGKAQVVSDWTQALTTPPPSQVRAGAQDTVDRDAFLAVMRMAQ